MNRDHFKSEANQIIQVRTNCKQITASESDQEKREWDYINVGIYKKNTLNKNVEVCHKFITRD